MPKGVEEDIIKGLYRVEARAPQESSARIRLLGSGAILPQVLEAARRLDADWGVGSEVWSATSFSELARDAREVERRNRLNPVSPQETSHVARCLPGPSPIIAATDYVRAYPQLIAAYVEAPLTALGTDGFGRSDTRAALRSFFEVNAGHIAVAALSALVTEGSLNRETVAEAIARYGIDGTHEAPWLR